MNTLHHNETPEVEVRNVRFDGDMLFIELSDERQIGLPFKKIKWLDWLAKATPEQRIKWSIEPFGYAVWWEELDDGFEVEHVLSLQPLPHKQANQEVKPILTTSQLEHNERFLKHVSQARESLRAGQGIKLEEIDLGE